MLHEKIETVSPSDDFRGSRLNVVHDEEGFQIRIRYVQECEMCTRPAVYVFDPTEDLGDGGVALYYCQEHAYGAIAYEFEEGATLETFVDTPIRVYAQYTNELVAEVQSVEEARKMAETSAVWIEEEDLYAEEATKMDLYAEKIEIVEGSECTDSTCKHFEAGVHPCEVADHDHMATHTLTHGEVAVYYLCAEGVAEFVQSVVQQH